MTKILFGTDCTNDLLKLKLYGQSSKTRKYSKLLWVVLFQTVSPIATFL